MAYSPEQNNNDYFSSSKQCLHSTAEQRAGDLMLEACPWLQVQKKKKIVFFLFSAQKKHHKLVTSLCDGLSHNPPVLKA